jgi:ubiquinone/menaquinone biosynthesis C-methylase UbiE
MASNYNRTAWFYDPLSYLVFGKAQVKAQSSFLHFIKPHSRILIAGGGTGQVLEALTRLHPKGLYIDYVEIAANMTAKASKRHTGANNVSFITDDINNFKSAEPFDVIITAFLFDNFTEAGLRHAFLHLHQQLKPGGLWLNTDFQLTGPLWQKLMLRSMYTFFRAFGAVEVGKLPDVNTIYNQYHYTLAGQKTFYGQFICTKAYQKSLL